MPLEEALMAFVGINIPAEERKKGAPLVSFVVKEGDGAVFVKPLPLPAADGILEAFAAGSEVLYRVDYLYDGLGRCATGIFTTGMTPPSFLGLLGQGVRSGNAKAGAIGLYVDLKMQEKAEKSVPDGKEGRKTEG